MRVGLFCIATKKYHVFVEPFLISSRRYFFKGDEHEVFRCLFADRPFQNVSYLCPSVVNFQIEHRPWPWVTLHRYHHFCQHRKDLDSLDLDFVLYVDIDALFMDEVSDDVVPEDEEAIVVVRHPGFYKHIGDGSWDDRQPKSQAYIPRETSKFLQYFAGGIVGGWYEAFMRMSETIRDMVDVDELNHILALWHDESHLQKYVLDKPKHVLHPGYCFPEGPQWEKLPFPKKIMVLEKKHAEIRSE